jgi:hypothetical protein
LDELDLTQILFIHSRSSLSLLLIEF